jgi:predicted esterase
VGSPLNVMPPNKLPESSDFPPSLHAVLHNVPKPTNAVLFLPGLGDTSQNFSSFARALNLPETLCITLQGPTPLPLPLPEGFHWGDDLLVDQSSGDLDPDAGFGKSAQLVTQEVVENVLLSKCGFKPREITLFGFGQGGMAALAIAKACNSELAGVISIGGEIPSSSMLVNGPKIKTPVLLLGGSKGSIASEDAVKSTKETFEHVEHHRWKKADDSMPKNREEALPMMQFFARRLRSQKGVPEGSVELS